MARTALSLLPVALLVLAFFMLIPATAEARYGGHVSIGYGHHGHHYGGYHGYHYRHHGYGYRPYRHHYKRHYYRPYRHYGHGGHHYGHSKSHHSPLYKILAAPAYLAYGILKTPALIVDTLTGSGHDRHYSTGYRHRDNDHDAVSHGENDTTYRSDGGTDETASGHLLDNPAWNALAQGFSREALRSFGEQAEAQPHEGEPKIGYALAAADSGDLDRGIWAMKRALRHDSDAFAYIRIDTPLRRTVGTLITRYEDAYRVAESDHEYRQDGAMMIAALKYLNGDLAAARQTIDNARRHADSEELNRLARLLEEPQSAAPAGSNSEGIVAGR